MGVPPVVADRTTSPERTTTPAAGVAGETPTSEGTGGAEERSWTSYETLSPTDRAAVEAMAEDVRARLRAAAGGYLWERYQRELDDPGLASLPRLLRNPLGIDADPVVREIAERVGQLERLEGVWDGIRAALGDGRVRLGDGVRAGEEAALWTNLLGAALPLGEDPGLRPALAGMIVDLAGEVGAPVVESWVERVDPAVAEWARRLRETGVGAGVLEERAARDALVRDLDRRWRRALESAWGRGEEAVWEAVLAEAAPHRTDPALRPVAELLVGGLARSIGEPRVGDGFAQLAADQVGWARAVGRAAVVRGQEATPHGEDLSRALVDRGAGACGDRRGLAARLAALRQGDEEAAPAESAPAAPEAQAQAPAARPSQWVDDNSEGLERDLVARPGADRMVAAGRQLEETADAGGTARSEGEGSGRDAGADSGRGGHDEGGRRGDGGGGDEGLPWDEWPLADPAGRALIAEPWKPSPFRWETEFAPSPGDWSGHQFGSPVERGRAEWVDADRGRWRWTYRGPRPHWLKDPETGKPVSPEGKDETREWDRKYTPRGPAGWFGDVEEVATGTWTQGGWLPPTPQQVDAIEQTFDKWRDLERWDLAFHRDDFTLPRPVRDVDVEWRGPDGRMETVPMRIDDLRAWYRRELELNLEVNQRLWDAMRRDYRERTGIPCRVEGDPGPWIFAGAHPDVVVDRRMAAWRRETGQEERLLGRPASADALHAEAERLEDALLGVLRSDRVGGPEDDAWLGRLEREYEGVMSRIGAQGARPGETVDDYLARTSMERLVEGGPPRSRPYVPPASRQMQTQGPSAVDRVLANEHRREETDGALIEELRREEVRSAAEVARQRPDNEARAGLRPAIGDDELTRFLHDRDAWDGWQDRGRVQAMTEAIEAQGAADRAALPTGEAQPSAADLRRRGDELVDELDRLERAAAEGAREAEARIADVADELARVGAIGETLESAAADVVSADWDTEEDREEVRAVEEQWRQWEQVRTALHESLDREGSDIVLTHEELDEEINEALVHGYDFGGASIDDTALRPELADEVALPSEEAMAAQDAAQAEASTGAEMAAEPGGMEPSGGMEPE